MCLHIKFVFQLQVVAEIERWEGRLVLMKINDFDPEKLGILGILCQIMVKFEKN